MLGVNDDPPDQARYALELKGFGLIVLTVIPSRSRADPGAALVDVAKSIDLQAVLDGVLGLLPSR